MRLLWVPLLLAPAGVVFVATRTAVDPIAGAERIDVVPHLPATVDLPTAAIGITTPGRHVTVHVRTERPTRHRVAKRPRAHIARAPRPVYVVPKTVVSHVTPAATVAPRAVHTAPKTTPKPVSKPRPKPTATPVAAPPATPPTTPEPTPPGQPPEPPTQPTPTPTPAAPPSPSPTPPPPTPARSEGDDDDQGDDSGSARPGNGFGDRNHEHSGPPGHDGDHGRHGHD